MDIRTPVATSYGDWLQKFEETWKSQIAKLTAKFGSAIEETRMPVAFATDVPIVYVKAEKIVEVLSFVKTDPDFVYDLLSDLTAIDEMPAEPRFEVVYNLFSYSKPCRMRFKVRVSEGQDVPTLTGVWKGANWAEREVFDMFGIKFRGHPDLRRILMDVRWEGHPLRKDYPLRGYQIFPTAMPVDPTLLED